VIEIDYPRIKKTARWMARRMPGNSQIDADDLAQQTALEFLSGRKCNLRYPMIDLMRQQSIVKKSVKGTGCRPVIIELLHDTLSAEPGLDSVLMNRISAAMSTLTKRESDVLHLVFWEGFTREEVVSALRINPTRVNKIQRRAIEKLRSQMGIKAARAASNTATPAEMKAWEAFVRGDSRADTAKSLGISQKTFDAQLLSLQKRLGLKGGNPVVKLTRLWFERHPIQTHEVIQ